jgi:peptidoglycan/LPS O-acetylase OafA/YrhL
LGWFGNISYSLYLMHSPVIVLLERLQGKRLPFGSGHVFFVEVLAVSTPVAWVSWRLIESPSIRLGRVLRDRLPATRPGSSERARAAAA